MRKIYFPQDVDKQSSPNILLHTHTCEPVLPFPFSHKCSFDLWLFCESQLASSLESVGLQGVQPTPDR